MTYHQVVATALGAPDVLRVVERPLRAPLAGEARIRVRAASVSAPDISVRSGKALYSGTLLGKKAPFVPGYAVIGDVDAVGVDVTGVQVGARVGVLTVVGGYSEVLYWRADRLIPVPAALDPAQAVTLILNYLVAYQTMHRVVKAQPGESALVIGASGGIGTALLQLGALAKLKLYGVASRGKHAAVQALGALPVDYRSTDFVQVLREAEPGGVDVVFDGMNRPDTLRGGLAVLRRGGRMVGYGEPPNFGALWTLLGALVRVNLLERDKALALYGTSNYFLFDRRPFNEDWATLFRLLEAGSIAPVIAAKFPLLDAARANALLESGSVVGNVVLVAPDLL